MLRWTRTQVADLLGVSVATLRTWERACEASPAQPSAFQHWAPAMYDHADVGMLQVIAHAHSIGLTGARLKFLWQALLRVRGYLKPGWCGLVVIDSEGMAWLVGDGVPGPASVDEILTSLPKQTQICTVSRMEVPA